MFLPVLSVSMNSRYTNNNIYSACKDGANFIPDYDEEAFQALNLIWHLLNNQQLEMRFTKPKRLNGVVMTWFCGLKSARSDSLSSLTRKWWPGLTYIVREVSVIFVATKIASVENAGPIMDISYFAGWVYWCSFLYLRLLSSSFVSWSATAC